MQDLLIARKRALKVRRIAVAELLGVFRYRWHFFKKPGRRYVENFRKLVKPARAHAVGAALVFLDLLEREVAGRAELFLAKAEKISAQPQARPHIHVDRIRPLLATVRFFLRH